MNPPRVLVAGLGNIFLGDDAFGVEVVQSLRRLPQPDDVQVTDFGIRGIDLTYALLDGPEAVILIDTVSRGGAPGTLYVLEPTLEESPEAGPAETLLDMHRLEPLKVLQHVQAQGVRLGWLRLIDCEPAVLGTDEDMVMGLSEPVAAAVTPAVAIAVQLVQEALQRPAVPA